MVNRNKLIMDNTHFILVVTNDNGIDYFYLSDTYDKCYQYLLHEYFEDDEEYLKECEDYNEDDAWFEEDSCWHFRIEQGKTL